MSVAVEAKVEAKVESKEPSYNPLKSVSLIVSSEHKRMQYKRRQWDEKKTVIHWGQRKLLFVEIMYLTQYGHLSQTVLYAGAAPGSHIPYLSSLFPTHNFVLVDPSDFFIKETDRIKIRNEYFTDEIATSFAGANVLFMSDMRTADHRQMSPLENEQYIIKDNITQMKWIEIMKPVKSMIKFRCPYPDLIPGKTSMYQGTIYLQPWAPASSTETRLIIDDSLTMTEYDNLIYEEQLYHHNNDTRYKEFSQPIKGEGLGKRFDDCAEVMILAEFLQKFPSYLKNGKLHETIAQMSYDISRAITTSKRTLATPMVEPEKKRQFVKKNHKQFYQ